jgi:hypothetical protein
MGEKLNNRELIETYDYDRKNEEGFDGTRYVFRNVSGDYLEVWLYDEDRTWYFILDNFPLPRKSFQHNIPYYSEDEFESDLRRMGIPVPEYKVKDEIVID